MVKLNRILCPTDFSEPSYAGLVAACTVARAFGAELILLNVTEPFVGHGDLLSDKGGVDCDLATAKIKLAEVIKPDTGEIAEEDDEAEIAPPVPLA